MMKACARSIRPSRLPTCSPRPSPFRRGPFSRWQSFRPILPTLVRLVQLFLDALLVLDRPSCTPIRQAPACRSRIHSSATVPGFEDRQARPRFLTPFFAEAILDPDESDRRGSSDPDRQHTIRIYHRQALRIRVDPGSGLVVVFEMGRLWWKGSPPTTPRRRARAVDLNLLDKRRGGKLLWKRKMMAGAIRPSATLAYRINRRSSPLSF